MAILVMGAASLAGACCALLLYVVLRVFRRPCGRACIAAAVFPLCATGYLLGCVLLSSMFSSLLGTPDLVFGDIKEILPNGYTLEALDKMPECGHIQKAGDSRFDVAWVRSAQIVGPYVLGQYDYTYFPKTPEESERNYFLFDTRNGETKDFASEAALAESINGNIYLTPTEFFRGTRPIRQRFASLCMYLIALVPPTAAGLWLIYRFLRFLRPG